MSLSSVYIGPCHLSFKWEDINYAFKIVQNGSQSELCIHIGYVKNGKPRYLYLSPKAFRKFIIKALKDAD